MIRFVSLVAFAVLLGQANATQPASTTFEDMCGMLNQGTIDSDGNCKYVSSHCVTYDGKEKCYESECTKFLDDTVKCSVSGSMAEVAEEVPDADAALVGGVVKDTLKCVDDWAYCGCVAVPGAKESDDKKECHYTNADDGTKCTVYKGKPLLEKLEGEGCTVYTRCKANKGTLSEDEKTCTLKKDGKSCNYFNNATKPEGDCKLTWGTGGGGSPASAKSVVTVVGAVAVGIVTNLLIQM